MGSPISIGCPLTHCPDKSSLTWQVPKSNFLCDFVGCFGSSTVKVAHTRGEPRAVAISGKLSISQHRQNGNIFETVVIDVWKVCFNQDFHTLDVHHKVYILQLTYTILKVIVPLPSFTREW